VKTDWDAWNARSLAEEDIVRLILDGTVVRVRLDRKATSISLLVVLGIRGDGQKVLLSVRNMGGESEAAWQTVLDDLIARGLKTPQFLIIDGAAGLERALAALWPTVPVQRCTVHTIRTQFPSELLRSITTWLRRLQRDDMADLQAAVANDNSLDHQLQDRLLVDEGRLGEAASHAGTECGQVRPHRRALQLALA
jgi:transposase-like protein